MVGITWIVEGVSSSLMKCQAEEKVAVSFVALSRLGRETEEWKVASLVWIKTFDRFTQRLSDNLLYTKFLY